MRFRSPVPLKAGCTVSYWFPTQFYDADAITSVRTGSLFGQMAETYYPAGGSGEGSKIFTIQSEAGGAYKSVTFASCATFRTQEAPETSRIVGLR